MDEEDFRSADFMTPSPPHSSLPVVANDTENEIIRKRRKRDVHHSVGSHIVYKRAALQSESDYGAKSLIVSHLIFPPIIIIATTRVENDEKVHLFTAQLLHLMRT